jgi:predicted DsbA family dithiol-disulfide isomerase
MNDSRVVNIEVVSDFVCPWCYVGKKRLERALAEKPELEVRISWLPFQLSPEMPREGRDRKEHYEQLFGEERAATIKSTMRETAREEGMEFGENAGAKSPNTLRAHMLMHWAQEAGDVDPNLLVEKLFAAHHVDCDDLGDVEVLARIAGEVGMDPVKIAAALTAGVDEELLEELMTGIRSQGVTGVPLFILNQRLTLSGAQPPEIFVDALEQLDD